MSGDPVGEAAISGGGSSPAWPPIDTRIIAHRHGGALVWPENSLTAARAAIRQGVTKIETDIHLNASGRCVLMHDATVARTTTGTGNVSELTNAQWDALMLDPDGWLGTGYTQERPPYLSELLDLLAPHPGITLVAEIKADAAAVPAFAEVRARGWDPERIWWSSFSQAALAPAIAAGCPFVQLFMDASEATDWAALRAAGITIVGLSSGTANAARVAAAHAAGLVVNVWTISRRADADSLLGQIGVDFVTSDDPVWSANAGEILTRDPYAFPQWQPGCIGDNRSFSAGGVTMLNTSAAGPSMLLQGWAGYIGRDTYSIEFEFKINAMGDTSRHLDVSFAVPRDIRIADATTDDLHYNFIARGNGDIGFWRVGGGMSTINLTGAQKSALGTTNWHTLRIDVTPESLSATLDGGTPVSIADTQVPRQGYFSIGPSSIGAGSSVSLSFRNIRVF